MVTSLFVHQPVTSRLAGSAMPRRERRAGRSNTIINFRPSSCKQRQTASDVVVVVVVGAVVVVVAVVVVGVVVVAAGVVVVVVVGSVGVRAPCEFERVISSCSSTRCSSIHYKTRHRMLSWVK